MFEPISGSNFLQGLVEGDDANFPEWGSLAVSDSHALAGPESDGSTKQFAEGRLRSDHDYIHRRNGLPATFCRRPQLSCRRRCDQWRQWFVTTRPV
ncbi:hypothetical protein FOCC_FOCC003752 [Frankliniella occidentalis]|nr:hypothetical protein FOCC_FOCC003752 [Frankliniella occidentalis]